MVDRQHRGELATEWWQLVSGAESEPALAPSRVETLPAWSTYEAAPDGSALAGVLGATSSEARATLLIAMENLFYTTSSWRVAQHLALLHMDRFVPYAGRSDLVKAVYFAGRACALSADDPRARIAMARVNWERRLPLAVLYDVETALKGEATLRSEMAEPRVRLILREAHLLEGMARAYLLQTDAALVKLRQAESCSALTVEGAIQLLLAAEPESPHASVWAAERIPSDARLGGRADAVLRQAHRRRILAVLVARARGLTS